MYKPSTYFDYDLFIFTPTVKIHIATGGAEIPWALINLTNNNLQIFDYYANLENEYKIETNPNLTEIVYQRQILLNENFSKKSYLSSFLKFANWGFYSFDKTNIENPQDSYYHLVAYPDNKGFEKNKFIELPENQKILNRDFFINPLIAETQFNNFQSIKLQY